MKDGGEVPKENLCVRIHTAGVYLAVCLQRYIVITPRNRDRGIRAILKKDDVLGVCHLLKGERSLVEIPIEDCAEGCQRTVVKHCRPTSANNARQEGEIHKYRNDAAWRGKPFQYDCEEQVHSRSQSHYAKAAEPREEKESRRDSREDGSAGICGIGSSRDFPRTVVFLRQSGDQRHDRGEIESKGDGRRQHRQSR